MNHVKDGDHSSQADQKKASSFDQLVKKDETDFNQLAKNKYQAISKESHEVIDLTSKKCILAVGEPAWVLNKIAPMCSLALIGRAQEYDSALLKRLDFFIDSSTTDLDESLISAIRKAFSPTFVLSTTEKAIPYAASLAERLSCPGPCTVSQVGFFYDKRVTREVLEDLGFAWPQASLIDFYRTPAPEWASETCVIKPFNGTGSHNVYFVTDDILSKISKPEDYIIEKFIDGPEYSVDTFSEDNEISILGVAKKGTRFPQSFVESSHFIGGTLPFSEEELVFALSAIFNKIKYSDGPAHTEFKYHDGKFVFLEFHCRPGGDDLPILCKLANGLDIFDPFLRFIGLAQKTKRCCEQSKQSNENWAFIQYFAGVQTKLDTIDFSTMPANFQLSILRAPRPDYKITQSADRTAKFMCWGSGQKAFYETRAWLRERSICLDEVAYAD